MDQMTAPSLKPTIAHHSSASATNALIIHLHLLDAEKLRKA
jgi:hypothetical protein